MPPWCYEPANCTTICMIHCSMQAFMPPKGVSPCIWILHFLSINIWSINSCESLMPQFHHLQYENWRLGMRHCVQLFFLPTFYSRVGESNCKVQHVLLLLRKGIGDLLIPLRVHYHMTRGTGESALTCTCCAWVESISQGVQVASFPGQAWEQDPS